MLTAIFFSVPRYLSVRPPRLSSMNGSNTPTPEQNAGAVSLRQPELPGAVQASLYRFMEAYEALRPELYRYCRYLTRSPWDAEDLAQDTLARAFVTLGLMGEAPQNPRAWLFRVASNLFIDQKRRAREVTGEASAEPIVDREPRAAREAAGTLMAKLSPRERAAVVLKDVFDLSLEEIAATLGTTAGTVKSCLSRGRGKLTSPEGAEPPQACAAVPAALDAFCAAFNAQDLDQLTALLLDTSCVQIVGTHTDFGPEAARKNALYGMLFGHRLLARGEGIEPRFVAGALEQPTRCEARVHRGETILLLWYPHEGGEAVRAFNRVELDGERVAGLKNYFYSPEALAELCRELDVPFRVNGYRHCLSSR
jgi:RNA polymerase sigma-70 factor, ECF subfamily